jgi:hypothetical protein
MEIEIYNFLMKQVNLLQTQNVDLIRQNNDLMNYILRSAQPPPPTTLQWQPPTQVQPQPLPPTQVQPLPLPPTTLQWQPQTQGQPQPPLEGLEVLLADNDISMKYESSFFFILINKIFYFNFF